MISWYAQNFATVAVPYDLQGIGITVQDLTKAQAMIQRDMPPLVKIASMLYFY